LGSWIEDVHPHFGPLVAANFDHVRMMDRTAIGVSVLRRETYAHRLRSFLGRGTLLCTPTAPAIAPRKGTIGVGPRSASDYFVRTLSQTSLSGIGRLPEVTLPVAEVDGVPTGLSLLAAPGNDAFVLEVVRQVAQADIG
jgi:amidase